MGLCAVCDVDGNLLGCLTLEQKTILRLRDDRTAKLQTQAGVAEW